MQNVELNLLHLRFVCDLEIRVENLLCTFPGNCPFTHVGGYVPDVPEQP